MTRRILVPLTGWKSLLFLWLLFFVGVPSYQWLVPSSYWLQVHSVKIISTFVGNDPLMHVERDVTMKENTFGQWSARLSTKAGELVCRANGSSIYSPNSVLPGISKLKLFGWWFEADNPSAVCINNQWPLKAGWYCLDTIWTFHPGGGYPPKVVHQPKTCFMFVERAKQ